MVYSWLSEKLLYAPSQIFWAFADLLHRVPTDEDCQRLSLCLILSPCPLSNLRPDTAITTYTQRIAGRADCVPLGPAPKQ